MHLTQRRRQVPSQCNTVLPSVCPGFCRGEQLVAFINPRRAPATVARLVCGEAGGALRPCSRNRGTANNGRDEQPVDPPTTGRACPTWEVAGPPPSLQLPSLRVHRWEARAHDQRSPVPFLGHDVLERPVLPNVHRRQQERAGCEPATGHPVPANVFFPFLDHVRPAARGVRAARCHCGRALSDGL